VALGVLMRFAFAFAFALAACGPEVVEEAEPIEESPALGSCVVECVDGSNVHWAEGDGDDVATCCDCRRAIPDLQDYCGRTLDDDAAEQCPDCNDLP
jgi:hypothetical protein